MTLELISEKVARWASSTCGYIIKIQFLPSTCNASDQLSRVGDGGKEGEMPGYKNVFKNFENI